MIARKEDINPLIYRISEHDDQAAFEKLFNLYFTWLKSVALAIVRKNEDAEEIIEDVFVKLWSMRDKLHQIKITLNDLFPLIRARGSFVFAPHF